MDLEWIGQITYGQISNIILALGLFGLLITIGVIAFIVTAEKRK